MGGKSVAALVAVLVGVLVHTSATHAADMPPAKLDALVAQLQSAFDDQRYLDAGRILDQARMASPSDSRLAYWAAQLALARGQYEDALGNFKAVQSNPELAGSASEGSGLALMSLGRMDEALPALQTAVEKNPSAWRAWNALGTLYDSRHDWTAAESAYERAIAASGAAPIALNNRGYSRLSQNRVDSAIADFVAALQKKPDLAPARNNLRLALSMKGEYERAISGAVAGDRAAALNNAGFTAMLRGDYSKAKELLTEAMQAKDEYYALAAENLELVKGLSGGQATGDAPSR